MSEQLTQGLGGKGIWEHLGFFKGIQEHLGFLSVIPPSPTSVGSGEIFH